VRNREGIGPLAYEKNGVKKQQQQQQEEQRS
jgi:hypothetical protein